MLAWESARFLMSKKLTRTMMSKEKSRSDTNSPDRVLVREWIARVGRPLVVKTLVESGWGVNSVDSAATKLTNYLSGERTINATDYVILVRVLFAAQEPLESLETLCKGLRAPVTT